MKNKHNFPHCFNVKSLTNTYSAPYRSAIHLYPIPFHLFAIPIHCQVTIANNNLDRGKRSTRRQKVRVVTEEKPKDIEVYEYRETSHKGSDNNPKHKKRGQTKTSVYNFRFESDDLNRTVPRQRENIFIRKPKVERVEGEAYELEDLANDDYFFEQLSKGQHASESGSESVEAINPKNAHENREVILLQIPADQKPAEKHRIRKRPKVYIKLAPIKEEDIYDDYGVMDIENASEEMQNSFEKEENIRAANLEVLKRSCGRTNCSSRKLKPKPKPSPQPKPQQRPILKLKPKQESVHVTEVLNVPPTHRQRSKSKRFERIVQTSKLDNPDELHDEIDKIFETKDKNYGKRGHDNSHWELRIVPKRYDDYTDV